MILCISLSPCIEYNMEVDNLGVGKVNKVISKRSFITGNALNVATGIARLGGDAFATGFMFEENGRLFEQELHKEGVTYKFVWNKGRVREVYKLVDMRSMLTEIEDDASKITAENADLLIQMVQELSKQCNAVVISGNCPEGLGDNYMERLLNAIDEKALKIIDTKGKDLNLLIKHGVDLIKPNLEEMQEALQIKITDLDSMKTACKSVVKAGAKRVLLSLGKRGAVIYDGEKAFYCTSLNVAMNSTAGAGDAMVAAATKSLAAGGSTEEILRCGVAAGTASVTTPDSISFHKTKFEEILNTLNVKEI
ncbi:MAG: 1-phosphofructokinase family hexose kinase [Candidatus Coproplasma sp.]